MTITPDAHRDDKRDDKRAAQAGRPLRKLRASELSLKTRHLRQFKPAERQTPLSFVRPGLAEQRLDISSLQDNGQTLHFEHFAPHSAQLDRVCGRFARGTMIRTASGLTSIEDLSPGDQIRTKDNGLQALRWISACRLPKGTDEVLPIRLKADALGDLRPIQDLVVSPDFRLLVNHPNCAMIFDLPEALAPVINLLDGDSIVRLHSDPDAEPGEALVFYNLAFDTHQIIEANGIETESYHPGDFGVAVMSFEQQSHLRTIFPHLDSDLSRFGKTVRPVLKGFETDVLRAS